MNEIGVIGDQERRSRYNPKLADIVNKEVERKDKYLREDINYSMDQGMPTIKLEDMRNTFVHVPSENVMTTLLRVYHVGGWITAKGSSPLALTNYWSAYRGKTCLSAENKIKVWDLDCRELVDDVISFRSFFKIQGIGVSVVSNIIKYFDNLEEIKNET